MSIQRSRTIPAAVFLALMFALAMLTTNQAQAATSQYPSGNLSSFQSGNGGWTSSAEYEGLCIAGLTCPELTGSYETTGGAGGAGDGFIRTNTGATTLTSLLSTSTHTWRSPGFTYDGVGGASPDNVRLTVGVKPAIAELLNLGVDVNVSATVAAVQGGGDQIAIDEVSPGSSDGWKTLTGQIGANALDVGKRYAIELSVSIGGLAAVLPSGSIGFDDVTLSATGTPPGNGNGSGNPLPPPKLIPPGVAYLYKNKLYVRVKCPRAFRPRCYINFVALTKRRGGKKLTPVRRANVRTGRSVRKVLGVRPGFRAKVRTMAKSKKRIVIRQKIRSRKGMKKAVRFQQLKVVVRRK